MTSEDKRRGKCQSCKKRFLKTKLQNGFCKACKTGKRNEYGTGYMKNPAHR